MVSKSKPIIKLVFLLLIISVILCSGCGDDTAKKPSKSIKISDLKMPETKFDEQADNPENILETDPFDPSREYTPDEYQAKIKAAKSSGEIDDIKKYYGKSIAVKGPGNAGITVKEIIIGEPKTVIRMVPLPQKDGKTIDVEVKTATVNIKIILKNISEFRCKSVSAKLFLYNDNDKLITTESIFLANISARTNKEINVEIKDLPVKQKETGNKKIIEFGKCEVFVLSSRWHPK